MFTTISNRYVKSLLRMAPASADVKDLLAEVGLPANCLEGDQSVCTKKYSRLFTTIVRSLQPVLHGTEGQAYSAFSHYRLILYSMIHAESLHEALLMANVQFQRLSNDTLSCPLQISNESVTWQFLHPEESGDPCWSTDVFSMKHFNCGPGLMGRSVHLWVWHRIASWLIGQYIDPLQITIQDDEPSSPNRYQEFFSKPLNYSQPSYGVVFSSDYLAMPIIQSGDSVNRMVDSFPEELFDFKASSINISDHISGIVNNELSKPPPTIKDIAKGLNISVPTLHRRLRGENTNYQKIKDTCRKEASFKLLQCPNRSIQDVATALGFSDVSSFHRAFKKWVNITPDQFRREQSNAA